MTDDETAYAHMRVKHVIVADALMQYLRKADQINLKCTDDRIVLHIVRLPYNIPHLLTKNFTVSGDTQQLDMEKVKLPLEPLQIADLVIIPIIVRVLR